MKIEKLKDCYCCGLCKNYTQCYKLSQYGDGHILLCENCLNELCKRWREIEMEKMEKEIDERIETIKILNDYLTWKEKKRGK